MTNETCRCPCCLQGIAAPHEYHLESRPMARDVSLSPVPGRRELPKVDASYASNSTYFRALGWNECVDEMARRTDPWRASVKELLALLTEPAHFNPDLLEGDSTRFSEYLDANEARIKTATARAQALLDGVEGRNG